MKIKLGKKFRIFYFLIVIDLEFYVFYLNYLGAISMHIKRWYPLHKIVGLYTPVFYYFIVQYFEEEICLDENAGLKDIILTFFLLNELSGACLEGFMEYFRVAFEDNSDLSVLCIPPPLIPTHPYRTAFP